MPVIHLQSELVHREPRGCGEVCFSVGQRAHAHRACLVAPTKVIRVGQSAGAEEKE
jgi:hypothetical protein